MHSYDVHSEMKYFDWIKLKSNYSGFSLLEVLFVLAILAVTVVALFDLFNMSLKMTWENKARAGAIQLANAKIEIARNLPYNDVGTVGGVVEGTMLQDETVTKNGIDYDVYTNVVYIDDEFDGTYQSDPADTLTNDYKRVLVRVSWESNFSGSPVDFYTDIAPRGVETTLGGGTLALTVFDAGGLPVDQASIHIYNDSVVPTVDTNTFSNTQGQLIMPGIKAGNGYEITVTKTGYSTDKTYDTTAQLPTPDPPHLTINEGSTTNASFQIDQLSAMPIHVQDVNGLSLGDIEVNIHGTKTIGWDSEGDKVYKYDELKTTDVNGNITMNNMEWDTYELIVASSTGYNISETSPAQPIILAPNDAISVVLTLEPQAEHSLIVVVKDVDDQPVEGALVHTTNVLGFDSATTTKSAGQAFFTPMAEATTTVEVTKPGYQDYLNEFILYGYTMEPVILVVP